MDTAIEKILESALLLFERGQLNMCSRALDEIAERLKTSSMPDALAERYNLLCKQVPSASHIIGTGVEDKCSACNGTGKYAGTSWVCFPCKGKGFQNAADVVRNKNYEARKKRLAAQAAAIKDWL